MWNVRLRKYLFIVVFFYFLFLFHACRSLDRHCSQTFKKKKKKVTLFGLLKYGNRVYSVICVCFGQTLLKFLLYLQGSEREKKSYLLHFLLHNLVVNRCRVTRADPLLTGVKETKYVFVSLSQEYPVLLLFLQCSI